MTTHARRFPAAATRGIAALLIMVQVAPATCAVEIADGPLLMQKHVRPNIMYVLDDSGSMNFEFLPRLEPTNDGALWWHTGVKSFLGRNANDDTDANAINYNKLGNASATWKKFVYLFPLGVGHARGLRTYADGRDDTFAVAPTPEYAWTRSSAYNSLYYDPSVTYAPWEPYNNGNATIAFPQATPTAAKTHPLFGSTTVDLTQAAKRTCDNCTFRMWPGMRAPANASYREEGSETWQQLTSDRTVPDGRYWDVAIEYYPATYYVVDPAGTINAPGGKKLREVRIAAGTAEMQNFANWFVYHRSRHLMVNAAIGASVNGVKEIRGGMVRLNPNNAGTRDDAVMYDFSATEDFRNSKAFLKQFYQTHFVGGTPTRDALDFAGKQFMRTDANAPIIHECQFNAAFVITDGFALNSSSVTLTQPNYDGQTNYTTYPYNRQNGNDLTHPYADRFDTTLADIAMQYYTTNLRPDRPAGQVPLKGTATQPDADRNPNLHMNTFALGLGVKGTIFGTGSPAARNPYQNPPAWPDPNAVARSPDAVDDLWHATLNGRGQMLSVSDAVATKAAMTSILRSVIATEQSAAGVAVSTAYMSGGDNMFYATSYRAGDWYGDLKAVSLRPTDPPSVGDQVWSARQQLDRRATSRYIVTATGGGEERSGIQFQPTAARTATKLTQAQETALGGASILAYLRGDRSHEGVATAPSYRTRTSVLGDMVNAEPVVLTKPSATYADVGYAAFR
ncbi:MAG: type pilus assembly protein PilY1, partial [Burkholderiales bacterium]